MKQIQKVTTNKFIKFRNYVSYLVLLVFVLTLFLLYQNNYLSISKYNINSNKLPSSFDGFKIVQLSDLHSKEFGESQSTLINKVEEIQPDIIVFTGDLIDSKNYHPTPSIELMEGLMEIAPVYFSYGNHEILLNADPINHPFKRELERIGINILNSSSAIITRGNDHISILGIKDPSLTYIDEAFIGINLNEDKLEKMIEMSFDTMEKEDGFRVLLSHRPEYLNIYSKYDIDLVFSGHAHGGQIRIPFIGGVFAPNQGFFPAYTSGLHKEKDTRMIINRGLGNSVFPLRLFNTPEIVVVTLSTP